MKKQKQRNVIISGIQQIGIGVENMPEAFKWYREAFGQDIKIFEEAATAELMLPYTGGEPRKRHAALAINMNGGGGFEIWQYTSRKPEPPKFEIKQGDLGFFACKIKTKNVEASFEEYKAKGYTILTDIETDPTGDVDYFFIKDPYNNIFQIIRSTNWYGEEKHLTGGTYGVIVGVTDIKKSMEFYSSILGYNELVYDVNESFKGLPGGENKVRRVLLKHGSKRKGAFSPVLGNSKIELVQVLDREPRKIYENRMWGDLGFIHLCFDINGMNDLREICAEKGSPFTVDSSNSFDMGEAAGHFAYIEDPDGALIEFVETHKIPVIKKIGWYINLRKRDPNKSLPNWMLMSLRFNRVR